MAIYLDEQLDDEPLFGIVARYAERVAVFNIHSIVKHLFGYGATVSHLPQALYHVARETRVCWGMQPDEIAERMTAFPYFNAFVSNRKPSDILSRMTSVTLPDAKPSRGGFAQSGSWADLRYCRGCLSEDERAGIPMHWRRVHQLPGVVICPQHREILCSYKSRVCRNLGYITPYAAMKSGGKVIGIRLRSDHEEAAFQISLASLDLLSGRWTIDRDAIWEKFLNFLSDRSDYFAGDKYKQCISILIDNTFGMEYVKFNSINFRNLDQTSILGMSPLRLLVLESTMRLIEAEPERLKDDLFAGVYGNAVTASIKRRIVPRKDARPSIECPSVLAPHGRGHAVEWTAWRRHVLQGLCSCGMTIRCVETENGISAPRITRWGPIYIQAVRKLKEYGWDGVRISEYTGVPVRTVFNMLKSCG